MMVCRNCGAEIDDKATSCPYCNAMQYDASEAEYMNNLYKMNSQMDNLDDEANKYVFSSVLKSAAIIIICIAAAVLIGIFWGFMRYRAEKFSKSRIGRNTFTVSARMDNKDTQTLKRPFSFKFFFSFIYVAQNRKRCST